MKFEFKKELPALIIVAASFIIGWYFYLHFPDRIISHWNIQGQPDGYAGKFAGALGIPLLILGMYLLFLVLPKIDPRKQNYQEFSGIYKLIRTAILLAIFGVFVVSGFNNLGYNIPVNKAAPFIIGLLFVVMGRYMDQIKPNWFIGVRTPWTLSSEEVWKKTHYLSGWIFMIFGAVLLLTPALPKTAAMTVLIAGIIISVLLPFYYSYRLYKKEKAL